MLSARHCLSPHLAVINKMSFYAVRKGRKVGIYRTWDECQAQVHQYKGAQFRKFKSKDEANSFIAAAPQVSWSSNASYKRSAPRTQNEALYKRKRVEFEYNDSYKNQSSYAESDYKDTTVVYTDGACTSNGRAGAKAGIGVYWGDDHPWNVSEKLCGKQTNQRAELTAALRAINIAKQNNLYDLELKTDSIYTIKCATEWIDKWKINGWKTSQNGSVLNRDLIEELDEAITDINVKWRYVPGHRGIIGNVEADRLANIGAAKHK